MKAMKRSTRQVFLCSLLMMAGISGAMAQKTPEYIYPSTPFNEDEAARQMEEGTATISGIAKIKKKGRTYFPWLKDQINLFPATAYIVEFAELKKKYTKGKKIATITNEAFTYRIEGRTTDDRGSFEFRNLKPGKYYIVTWIDYEKQYTTKERTGTDYAFNQYGNMVASYPIYTYYTHKYAVEMEVSGMVEVKADGEKITVEITN